MTAARDPRLADLQARILAAAARNGTPPAEFALKVELYTRALAWQEALARLGIGLDDFIEGMRQAGQCVAAATRSVEALGAAFRRYEPSEFS